LGLYSKFEQSVNIFGFSVFRFTPEKKMGFILIKCTKDKDRHNYIFQNISQGIASYKIPEETFTT
jgi:hypothetical protein